MLPANDIINIHLCAITGSIYVAILCFLWPILINADLIPPPPKPARREDDNFNREKLYEIC